MARAAENISGTNGFSVTYGSQLATPNTQIIDGQNAKYHLNVKTTLANMSSVNLAESLTQPKINLSPDTGSTVGTIYEPTKIDYTANQTYLDFKFYPGVVAVEAKLTDNVGTSISSGVTNGFSNTTSRELSASTSVTVGVEGSVSVPLVADAKVKTEITNTITSTFGSSQTVDYSTSNDKQASTSKSTEVSVRTADALVQGNGTYTYTNKTDPTQTFTFNENQEYRFTLSVTEGKAITPANHSWDISSRQNLGISDNLGNSVSENAGEALKDAISWNYQGATGQTLSGPLTFNGAIANYTGSVAMTSNYGVGLKLVVFALNDLKTPITPQSKAVVLSTQDPSADPTSAGSQASVAPATTTYNLQTLASQEIAPGSNIYGIAFDDTQDEFLATTSSISIIGGNDDMADVGNLNYIFTQFTNSQIIAGNGDNIVTIAATENGNNFQLGNGNNTVLLNGNGNTITLGGGANVVTVNGNGTNDVDANGSTILVLNSLTSMTDVNNWDSSHDKIQLGPNINLSQISVVFNAAEGTYRVYAPGSVMIAELVPSSSAEPVIDNATQQYSGTNVTPIAFTGSDNTLFLNSLFADAFGSALNSQGLTAWNNLLNNGVTRIQAVAAAFKSSEYNALHPTDVQFINAVSHDLLGHTADASTQSSWLAQYAKGVSHGAFVDSILTSNEFANIVGISNTLGSQSISNNNSMG